MTAPSELRALVEGVATIESEDRNVMGEVVPTRDGAGPRGRLRTGTALGSFVWSFMLYAWRGTGARA